MSNQTVRFLSSTPEKIFGISQEEFVEKPFHWRQLIHPDDLENLKNNQKELYSGLPIKHQYRIIRPDGEIRWLMNQTFPKKDPEGQITYLLGITFDITVTKNYESQLETTNNELRDITNALHLTADVTITDTNGTITYANDKFCEISKYTREELIGQNHRLINSGYHSKEEYKKLWDTITQGQVWHKEVKNKAKDGTYFWSDSTIVPFLNEDGVPYQYIAIRKDITAKKENEEAIRKLAFEDILTQLPNIRSLETHLDKLCQNKENKFVVLLIGLDHFKSINDHYGFKTGDQVLIEVSKKLARVTSEQKNGFIFRCRGDEFSILLEGIDAIEQVTHLAEKILKIINRPIQIKDQVLYITATIGISCFPMDGNEGITLLEKAGLALNKGKSSGKIDIIYLRI
jgi:diguanylate cyclase (GGDEF)-like protein/PAS domain S-box-containing protein